MKGWFFHHPVIPARTSGDSKGDGEYWIDREKSGNHLKVFCDMTSDGGKWRMTSKKCSCTLGLHNCKLSFIALFCFSLKVFVV